MTDTGLVIDERTKIKRDSADNGWLWVYSLDTRYGCSTREIALYHCIDPEDDHWWGDIIEFGEWRRLDEDEIQQCKEFLTEKGYL